ncbi:MAG: hypothetical protein AAFP97_09325 [Pseudomonadota bacterium]
MTHKLGLAALCLTFSALTACATTSAPTSSTTATVAEATTETMGATEKAVETAQNDLDPNRQVCKRTKVVGSNFKKKICRTANEWEALEQQSREATERIQRGSRPTGAAG